MIRYAMRRVALLGLSALSVTLLATCDLATLTGTDTTSPATRLDSTDLTVSGGTGVVLGASITMGLTSPLDLSSAFKRWTSSAPATVSIDSMTGVATGLAIGSATITGRVVAPEIPAGVSKSQVVTVRYASIRITAPVVTDSMSGLGQARTVTVQGTNSVGATQAGSLSTGLTLTSSDPTVFSVSGSTIVAKKNGSARVVAVYQTLRDSVLIKVRQVARKISFPGPDSLNYVTGALNTDLIVPLTVRDVADSIVVAPVLTWRVADTTVATIGATSGILRVKKVDTTRIFAKMDTVERSQKLLVILPPTAPTTLTATTASSTQINLTWVDNASTETGFRIERCSGVSCTSFAEIATVAANVTSYSSTALTAATAYSYRVRSYNAGGNSAYTTTASATTLPNAPAAPTNLAATVVSISRIDLTWTDNATNETLYSVERCSGVSCTAFVEFASSSANTVSQSSTGLAANTSYSFRVKASNTGGNSGYSNTVSATTLPNAPDLIVTVFTAPTSMPTSGTVNISVTVKNQGGVAAGAFRTGIYFSTNNIISTGDTPSTGFCDSPTGLAVGATTSCSGAIAVPTIATGTYFVGALTDDASQVTEFNENNNASTTVTAALSPLSLITNSDFASGTLAWNFFNQALVLNLSGLAYSTPNYLSLLSNSSGVGQSSITGSAYQDISIPAGATTATLEFRYNISTDETTTTLTYDSLKVTVQNTSGTVLATVLTVTNLNKSAGTGPANYTFKAFDLSSFKGQTVRIHFSASNDVTLPTVFRIDDVKATWGP